MEDITGYVEVIRTSFIDIPSQIASVVFFRGCSIKCKDCQNCCLQTFDPTKLVSSNKIVYEINEKKLNNWVCFQGGEPFDQPDFLYTIIKNIKKNVCIFTGYSHNIVFHKYNQILDLPNVKMVKTGNYISSKKIQNKFLATTNQKVYLKQDEEFILFNWKEDINNQNFIKEIENI